MSKSGLVRTAIVRTKSIYFNDEEAVLFLLIDITERIKAEKLMKESEQKFKTLSDSNTVAIMAYQGDAFIYANKASELLSGYSLKEIIGMKYWHFVAPEFKEVIIERGKHRQAGDTVSPSLEFKIITKTGKEKWVTLTGGLIELNGKTAALISVTDNTLRVKFEQSLIESESKYRELIENSPIAIAIYQDGKIVLVNHQCCTLIGTDKKEDLIGKSVIEFVHPDFRPFVIERMQKAIAERKVLPLAEEKFMRIDGTPIEVEVKVKAMPIRFEDKPAVQLIMRDITERKKAQIALQESEEKYRLLVQYSGDPIFSINPDETYRYVNEAFAKRAGKKQEEIIGKTPYDIYPHDEAEMRLRVVRNVFLTGEREELEFQTTHRSGEKRYYLTKVDPFKDENGITQMVSCISLNITDRKKSEEEVKKKNAELEIINAEKDKLFSIIAHDLRSPFHGLLGLTEIMSEGSYELSLGEIAGYSKNIHDSVVSLYKLLENLLLWAQFQKGGISYSPRMLNLNAMFSGCIEIVKQVATQKGITILNKISVDQMIYADEKMTNSILRNLLSNALKYTVREGKVTATSKKLDNGLIEISVKDTGIGLSPQNAEKLFMIGEKVSTKGVDGETGTGLGLMLCKEFVEKHGGTIWVKTQVGKGSTFYFTLPGPKQEPNI